jgi:hypothetical protein
MLRCSEDDATEIYDGEFGFGCSWSNNSSENV